MEMTLQEQYLIIFLVMDLSDGPIVNLGGGTSLLLTVGLLEEVHRWKIIYWLVIILLL